LNLQRGQKLHEIFGQVEWVRGVNEGKDDIQEASSAPYLARGKQL
jgi:hypothetical protein